MSATEIFICEGKHCSKKSKDMIDALEKEFGSKKIKIKKSKCLDECECAQVAFVKEAHGIYLKGVHKYKMEQWKELFDAIKEGKNIKKLDFVKTI